MPIFEFECGGHGKFEVLRNSIAKDGRFPCPTCKARSPLVAPLTVMRPDSMWAGHDIPGHGHVTSQSRLDKSMKEKKQVVMGDKTDVRGMRQMAEEAAKARDAKFLNESREFMRQKAAERGLIDAFGNLKPEALKPLSDTPLIHTDDERVKSTT